MIFISTIDFKLSRDNMIYKEYFHKVEIGLRSNFYFNCDCESVELRIIRNKKIIGTVKQGEYFTSYTDSSKEIEKAKSEGEWEFIFYLLKDHEPVYVNFTFEQKEIKNKIYRGDLHSHSICSEDAVNTFKEIENEVLRLGNDFHAVTDHNSFVMNLQYLSKTSNVEFIYGVEMTNRYGHYNFLGVEIPVDTCQVETEDKLLEKIIKHKANGGYVTFNHPFSPKSRICRLPINKKYCDFIEIWNGPWEIHNIVALKWWHKQLLNNVYYPICGGSDTHDLKDSRYYGNPTNCILAPYNEQKVLLTQLKKGHSYILSEKERVNIETENVIFGDILDNICNISFNLKFASKNAKDKLHVITEKDKKVYFLNEAPTSYTIDDNKFIRFEAYDEYGNCIFISNPIFGNSEFE